MKINIIKDSQFIDDFEKVLHENGPFSQWELFQLTYRSELTRMIPSFHGLRSLQYLPHMNFLPHQTKTARTAIEHMNGRAILADEVGLGKTIEAGLILKEYMVRGLVQKALLLVPASLTNQWVRELNEKFYISAVPYHKNVSWEYSDIIVASIDTAKRSPHREKIEKINYDFVLVDEAHMLKNRQTINYDFVRSLQKKYCLLLTATPIQNKLSEIFNLVSILKPGHLGDYQSFSKKYGKNQTIGQQDQFLKELIQQVMIRNTRKSTELNQVKRKVSSIWLDFPDEEYEIYKKIEQSTDLPKLAKITYLRELCSSREACLRSLQKTATSQAMQTFINKTFQQLSSFPEHIKAQKTVELIRSFGDEKVIIFTEYRATQIYLQWYLLQHEIQSVPYRGGFKTSKKDWMRELFQGQAQVLIATEAGGHGINLQFCNHLINYDLPWNPMRLEQRIGRIHRYGQDRNVHIYNLAIRGTIEEYIMNLLYEKINLFEKVIGDLDAILANLKINNLEKEMTNIFTTSRSDEEAKIKLSNLSEIIQQNVQMKRKKG